MYISRHCALFEEPHIAAEAVPLKIKTASLHESVLLIIGDLELEEKRPNSLRCPLPRGHRTSISILFPLKSCILLWIHLLASLGPWSGIAAEDNDFTSEAVTRTVP